MYGLVDELQDLRRQVRFYRVVSGILAVLLFLACFIGLAHGASAAPSIKERCNSSLSLDYLGCITYGEAWVVIGTDGPDELVGYPNKDIIRSGKGADYVNGKAGYDVCYVQPADTVKNCEEER
jgi:hypothetical protein